MLIGWVGQAVASDPMKGIGKLETVLEGRSNLDTPAWLPRERCLLIVDVDAGKLLKLNGSKQAEELRGGSGRVKVGPGGTLYAVLDGVLATWAPGGDKKVILEKAAEGRTISLNDLAVSPQGFLYFTTLKDPDKGRLSVVDLRTRSVRAAWEGAKEPTLWNPNGVAVSPDGKCLYVGISSYAKKSNSGVYRFPILPDGSIDVPAGKKSKWAAVAGPDGIAVDREGNVYFTAGAAVHVYSPEGKKWGAVKIPKGNGTNLGFGGEDLRTLYVTTRQALYQVRMNVPGFDVSSSEGKK